MSACCHLVLLILLGVLAVMTGPTHAQPVAPQGPAEAAPAPPALPEPAEAPPPAATSPGLIDRLGDFLKDSVDGVSSNLKGTQQTIENFNKGAADTLSRVPVAGIVNGRVACARAENGAPDCRSASERLCKDKGYGGGRSLDTESAQNCPARVYLPGYQRKDGDCRLETFVTRAACQ
jgi:hypothetical protein